MQPMNRLISTLAAVAALLFANCSREPEYIATLDVAPKTPVLRAGQCVPLTLTWTPAAELTRREGRPTVFVHLLDGPHNLVRTYDHPLAIAWQIGSTAKYDIDLCESAIAPALPAGTYNLKVGLYDDVIGYRWPLKTGGVDAGKRSYRVGQVVVPASGGAVPKFDLAGNWGAREEVKDKQIRARQRFTSGARMTVAGVTAPGVVRLAIQVPDGTKGATTVQNSCGGEWSTTAPGSHLTELPVNQNGCVLTFNSAGAYLESVGWKAAK